MPRYKIYKQICKGLKLMSTQGRALGLSREFDMDERPTPDQLIRYWPWEAWYRDIHLIHNEINKVSDPKYVDVAKALGRVNQNVFTSLHRCKSTGDFILKFGVYTVSGDKLGEARGHL